MARKRAWYGGAGINTQIHRRARQKAYDRAPKCTICGSKARSIVTFGTGTQYRCGRHERKLSYGGSSTVTVHTATPADLAGRSERECALCGSHRGVLFIEFGPDGAALPPRGGSMNLDIAEMRCWRHRSTPKEAQTHA